MRFVGGVMVTIERETPGGRDRYGDPVAGTVTTHLEGPCAIAPRTSTELHEPGRAGVIVGLSLYAPADADIRRTDRVVIPAGAPNAGRWEVEGEPAVWSSPLSGQGFGLQVALRRSAG